MKNTSLQKTLILSFAFHILLLLFFGFILRHTNRIIMPSPYTVNLVSLSALQHRESNQKDNISKPEISKKESIIESKTPEKNVKDNERNAKDFDYIEKKISLMAAKKKIEEKFAERKVISLKAKEGKKTNTTKTDLAKNKFLNNLPHSSTKGSLSSEDYYSKITDEIRQQWIYPDLGNKKIEAIVSVKILKDGTTIVQKMEKSSGNILFDRSALRALAKSSPLPPPPYEMEIGVRFYP